KATDTVSFKLTDGAGNVFNTSAVTLTGTQATDLKQVAAAINQAVGSDSIVATVNANGSIDLSSTTSQTIAIATTATQGAGVGATGTETAAAFGMVEGNNAITTAGNTVDKADVTTVDNSNKVLLQIDSALQSLATTGAQLGAYQNRFQAAITGLTTDATNLSSARSQIQDTDYEQATSQLSKAQILQQASTAMEPQ